MASVLTFELSEFEVLETFEHEEDVQRPEEVRFYTLDEQLLDYVDKVLPKRKPTSFEMKEIKYTQERIREAYGRLIKATDSSYVIDTKRKSINVPWVSPVYSAFEYKAYSYEKEWMPFFEQGRRRTANYYTQLLAALPRPYISTGEGRLVSDNDTFVNDEGKNSIGVLGNYVMTKTRINDDNTYDILKIQVPNTNDDIKSTGFFLHTREFEIPRPMTDHPFLRSNQPSYVETENTLMDIFPSIEAIMEHAIPVTTDPYTEGKKYLKLYDIKFSQIGWSSWKERFPPVEAKETAKRVSEITFNPEKIDIPGDVLTKTYTVPFMNSYHSRKWLSLQVDAGTFISKILMSEASNSGLLPIRHSVDIQAADFPEADPEVCINLTSNFDMFMQSGLYRPIRVKDSDTKQMIQEGVKCVMVPIGTILQEKSNDATKNRLGWKETTKNDILKEYQQLLKEFQLYEDTIVPVQYEKAAHIVQSERYRDVQVILEDPRRDPIDKAEAIERLVRDLNIEKNLYLDVEGQYVVCSHTLEILHGKLAEDRLKFYSEWTVSIEGFRMCKYCGEQINKDTEVATTEYDEDGHVVMDYQALEKSNQNTSGNTIIRSLIDLKAIFNLENAGEAILFILFTFLQVLPNEQQVLPVLQLIRALTSGLKARSQATKAISKEKQDLVEGILGLAGAVILMQAHSPLLIPRRQLNTSGYPRDSDDPKTCNTLSSLLLLLRRTFEDFPTTYKGNVAVLLRDILRNSEDLKAQSMIWVKVFADKFKAVIENAREKYNVLPEEKPMNSILLPIEKLNNPIFRPGEFIETEQHISYTIPRTHVVWDMKRGPSVRQKVMPIQKKIEPSPIHTIIQSSNKGLPFIHLSEAEIRKKVGLGLPPAFNKFEKFVKSGDAVSFVSLASQLLTIVSKTTFSPKLQKSFREQLVQFNTSGSQSLSRDIAKGLLFEVLHAIKGSLPATRLVLEKMNTDLTLRILLTTNEEAMKEDFALVSKERNLLKSTLRSMTDSEREITQQLVKLGIADFIVTNVDRERFSREFREKELIEEEIDANRPEEGYNDERDFVENGDQPIADDGRILEVDYGDYGDRAVRDYNDYGAAPGFDEEG